MAVAAPAASAGRVALLCARPGALGRRAAAAWVLLGPGGQPLSGGHLQQLQRLAGRAALGHLRGIGAEGDSEPGLLGGASPGPSTGDSGPPSDPVPK